MLGVGDAEHHGLSLVDTEHRVFYTVGLVSVGSAAGGLQATAFLRIWECVVLRCFVSPVLSLHVLAESVFGLRPILGLKVNSEHLTPRS
jgi:hypothetical protein